MGFDENGSQMRLRVDLLERIIRKSKAVFMWRDPYISTLVFSSGLLVFLVLRTESYSLVSIACYLCLLHISSSIVYIKGMEMWSLLNGKTEGDVGLLWRQNRQESIEELFDVEYLEDLNPELYFSVGSFLPYVQTFVDLANLIMYGVYKVYFVQDFVFTIKIALLLVVLSVMGTYFHTYTLLLLIHIIAFTAPVIYSRTKKDFLEQSHWIRSLIHKFRSRRKKHTKKKH